MTKEEALDELVEKAVKIMLPFSYFAVMEVEDPNIHGAAYNFHLIQLNEARRLARKLVEAGWRP